MRAAHRARGQALVEAAVSFPLLVLLLLVVVEGALYVHALHVVLGAAREGAHAAAAEHATLEEAVEDGRTRAREVLDAGLGRYAVSVEVLDPAVDYGSVLVEVRGAMPLFFGGPGQDSPLRLPLDARARASREFFHPQRAGGY
jgi:Flp pilus assembly protein TadG